jgi:transaldolase
MKSNPLRQIETFGQSIWLDYLRRDLMESGGLRRLIEEDGVRGMASNPTIFENFIVNDRNYEADIRSMSVEGMDAEVIYENLSRRDVQMAADEFRPLYERMDGGDGYASLEVNPHLAYDTNGTIAEARRLWAALDRPNVFIKIPATVEGLPAIKQLTSEGININVSLLFGLSRYHQAAESYIAGLEERLAQGKPIKQVESVASFFIRPIDILVDQMLEEHIAQGGNKASLAKQVVGKAAIACAKMAYQMYKELFNGERFKKLAEKGARTQRLLWAGTRTNHDDYDVKYIEAFIGPDTVNTVSFKTLNDFRVHGIPKARLEDDIENVVGLIIRLSEIGISIDTITQQLENESVEKFTKQVDRVVKTVAELSTVY